MEKRFRQIVARAGLEGSCLLLGVSGGVDSVVLLDLLAGLALEFGLLLRVLHLDHRLREESGRDAEFVVRLCEGYAISCHCETVEVAAVAAARRLSIETAGREVRRELLQRLATRLGCRRIVLGHHRDDQVETFLQRLLRGSGASGLQGMREDDGRYWRPLLAFSREQILAHARRRGLSWLEDVSNADPRFLRNRIRHQLLPQLQGYNPRIGERIAALGSQLQREEDFWQAQIDAHWPRLAQAAPDGLRLDVAGLQACHPALLRRLLREGLRMVRGDLARIESVHIEALHGLLDADAPQGELDLPGCWAARRYDCLWLRRKAPQIEPFALELRPGETLRLPDGRRLRAELVSTTCGETAARVEFDAASLRFPLQVRSPRPGDRFQPSGMEGQRKVKDFLIDLKVEKEERRKLPLLCCGEDILWLVGMRRSQLARVHNLNAVCLKVSLDGAGANGGCQGDKGLVSPVRL